MEKKVNLIQKSYRLIRRVKFRYSRLLFYAFFRLWLKKIHNFENFPKKGPCIIISNHTSYVDWIILSAIYRDKYIVFLGNMDLKNRPIVNWLMKLNILIYVDTDNPGYTYFREVIRRLRQGHIVVIYPEGTRSKNGHMLKPKIGFVKLALMTGVPLIPLGIKGAYKILPPKKSFPRLNRCEVFVGKEIYIKKSNPMFSDIFEEDNKIKMISKDSMQEVAFRIMDVVRIMANQEWDKSVQWFYKNKEK